jgi:hypothetical protein
MDRLSTLLAETGEGDEAISDDRLLISGCRAMVVIRMARHPERITFLMSLFPFFARRRRSPRHHSERVHHGHRHRKVVQLHQRLRLHPAGQWGGRMPSCTSLPSSVRDWASWSKARRCPMTWSATKGRARCRPLICRQGDARVSLLITAARPRLRTHPKARSGKLPGLFHDARHASYSGESSNG